MAEELEVEQQEAAPEQGVTESTESATGEQQEPQDGEAKPKGGFQKKIDRLTKERTLANEQAEYWKAQALKTTAVEAPKPQNEAKPSENDYQTHTDFVEALADWKYDQRRKSDLAAERAASFKTESDKALQDFASKEREFRSKTSDYDEVMEDAMSISATDAVIAEVVQSGPELKYYLAKNPAEVERLNKLGPIALAREVGKIEARFTTSPSEKTATVTKAPAPITPVGRASSTSRSSADATSYADFEARRNAEIAARNK